MGIRGLSVILALAAASFAGTWVVSPGKGSHASAAGPPAFVSEVQRTSGTSSSGVTNLTLTGGIAQGHLGVLFTVGENGSTTNTPFTDSKGNSWVRVSWVGNDGNATQGVTQFWAYINTALVSGDTFPLDWTGSFTNKTSVLVDLSGCSSTQYDVNVQRTVFTTGVTESGTTTAANTLCIGILTLDRAGTYSGGSWTTSGTSFSIGARTGYIIYKQLSAAGAQNPGGTWSTGGGQANGWTAFK